jgi:uncharacterized protein (TIGR02001 family)
MNPTLRACAAAVVLALPALAGAQSAAKPEPEFTFTGNAGVFSDYRFRGMTQTNYGPAFQGGFDFAHKSGFYLGNWNSNVEQLLYNGASLEMDFYGGYKTSFGDFGVDVGALYYYYPKTGALGTAKIDNTEIYVGGSYGPLSVKYFHAISDFFGVPGTKNSYYLDGTASFEVSKGLNLVAHVGYQKVKGLPSGITSDNIDYRVGVTYDVEGWIVGASVIANSEKAFAYTGGSGFTKPAGKTAAVVSLTKSF